jgi:hypothetical protein
MYFFSETSLNISTSTAVGSWNVAGYQELNLHIWAKGGQGTLYMESYFNNLSAYSETLTIGSPGPGGWSTVMLTRTYPVLAPKLTVVLYNPTTPVDFMLRLYAACCEAPSGVIGRLLPPKRPLEGDAERKLNERVDVEALARASGHPHAPS